MSEQKIVPCIWGSTDPQAMFDYYNSVFDDVHLISTSFYPTEGLLDFQKDMAGKVLTITFSVLGTTVLIVNGGPVFCPNPSVSFMVRFAKDGSFSPSLAEMDSVWAALSSEGSVLMPLDEYPFSSRYGWIQDKYGVSWQLIANDEPESSQSVDHPSGAQPSVERPVVMPVLMFSGLAANHAEEAMNYYGQVFPNTQVGEVSRYPSPEGTATTDSIAYADCAFDGQWLAFMDSGTTDFTFSEGLSLIIDCKDQAEIDHYWQQLSHVPEAEQCGWCKDQFGVSWQVTPLNMDDLIATPRAYAAMMEMKKIDLGLLEQLS